MSLRFAPCIVLLLLGFLAVGLPRPLDANASPPMREFIEPLVPNEELVQVDTRPGVTVRVLLTKPEGTPKGVVLIYPGGPGFLVVNRQGGAYGAFRREFADFGYLSAVVDVPSDVPEGLGGGGEAYFEQFRLGDAHTRDTRAVIDALSKRWSGPVYLFGHSMGAISVAHLAATLNDHRLRGIVLAGSPTKRGPQASWVSVPSARLDKIKVPTVLVHHRNDGCAGSTFEGASDYPRHFSASPRVGFIAVTGGWPTHAANPCEGNNHHSFSGKRREVVDAVIRWMNGENIARIGD